MGNHFRWPHPGDPQSPNSLPLFFTVLSHFSRLKTFHSETFGNLLKYQYIFTGKMGIHFWWPISDDPPSLISLPLILAVLTYFSRLKTFHVETFCNLLKYYYIFTGKMGNHFKWPNPGDPPSLRSLPLFLTVLSYFSRLKTFHSGKFFNLLKYNIFSPEKWAITFDDLFQTTLKLPPLSSYFSQFCHLSLAWKLFTL